MQVFFENFLRIFIFLPTSLFLPFLRPISALKGCRRQGRFKKIAWFAEIQALFVRPVLRKSRTRRGKVSIEPCPPWVESSIKTCQLSASEQMDRVGFPGLCPLGTSAEQACPTVSAGTIAVAAAGLGFVCRKAGRIISSDKLSLMGIPGAFILAAQMVNFHLPAMPGSGSA